MNSVPNSDSEQRTESKLGWVHQVHTLNPAYAPTAPRPQAQSALGAMSWSPLGRVVAPSLTVSWSSPAVSLRACAHWRTVSQRCVPPLDHDTKIVLRPSLLSSALPLVSQGTVSQLCRDTRPPPSHDTMFVSRLPPPSWSCAHAVAGPCLSPTTPCRGVPLRTLVLPCAPWSASQAMPVKPCVTIQLAVL